MFNSRLSAFFVVAGLFSAWSLGQATHGRAEAPTPIMSSQFVPDDGIAVAAVSPAELLENPVFELFPTEVFRVQAKEQLGVDPASVSLVKAVLGMSANGQPQFGAIIMHDGTVNFEKLRAALGSDGRRLPDAKRDLFTIDGPPGSVNCNVDPKTIYVGLMEYMEPMLVADNGTGALPSLLKTMPARPGINAAISMEAIRPMVSGIAMQQARALRASLQPLGEIPGLTDVVKVHFNVTEKTGNLELTLVGVDNESAVRIESILRESLVAARELGIAEVIRSMKTSGQSNELADATRRYAQRIADRVVKTLMPIREGDHVTITIDSQLGIASSGVLVGLLLPAVQSARQAARRMSASNNFKQVMLAMHNYHSAYRKLPNSAITDADGKALLSWRVAILPFIEEQELYQQFHLDEPWDSEHNLPLSKELPAVYETPGVELRDGETVIQAVVGEKIGMRPLKETRFRDILDGLSNTILIVETNPDSAVPWSKPADVAINLDDPLEHLKGTSDKGFHVGMGDGAVRFIADTIDPDLMKRLLTRAGKEMINQW